MELRVKGTLKIDNWGKPWSKTGPMNNHVTWDLHIIFLLILDL